MLNKLKPKSEFGRNILILMTGTSIAQAIPIAISPVLTRIYTPKDFGILALFTAIVSIFGAIANGRYELAIMLPKEDEDAINIFALGFLINIVLTVFITILIFVFHNNIINLIGNKEIYIWLYFVPIAIFLTGIFNLLNYFNNRLKQYEDLAKSSVYKSIAAAIVQLLMGFLKTGALGLISGNIISMLISNLKLFSNIVKLNLFSKINRVRIIINAKKYKKFFLIDTIVATVYILYNRAIIIVLQKLFSSSIVGNYFFAERLIQLPLSFIKGSISNVFFEKISQLSKEEIYQECQKLSFKLFVYSILPFSLIVLLSKYYIPIIFGDKWANLYIYMIFISLPVYISFLMSPYSYILKIIDKQEISLYFHLVKLFVMVIYFSFFTFLNFIDFIFYFSFLDAFIMLIFLHIQIFYLNDKLNLNYLLVVYLLFGGIIVWYVKF